MLARRLRSLAVAALALAAALPAAAQEVLRIAYVDPLSGPFANTGEGGLKHYQFMADELNRRNAVPGVKFEIVGFDNKVSPQETLNVFKQIVDRGIRYVAQGNSSAVALALSDAVQKHNERNPGKEILYINYAAVDPDLTNSKCHFFHFRFDANSDMKMEALTTELAKNPKIKKVYLINQNYSFGQAVSRAAKADLKRKRSDVEIVGDDLHPLGQVKDFAPYVAKIKAAGADTVITGNWGVDLSLLVKAAREAGLNVTFYTYYAGFAGVATAVGEAGVDRMKQITEWHTNVPSKELERINVEFKKKYNLDWWFLRVHTATNMLAEAMKRAKSSDPVKVAQQLSGMKHQTEFGDVEMRAADHQLIQPLYISTFARSAAKGGPKEVRFDVENTGYGFRTDVRIEPYVSAQPTSCQMKRPGK
ncbi:MAG TPA: branched-chain amino acid ABC transporter substrate-binding protein [Burkholderiales bacterium]|nr:branched-chain amino acid ABC transporter substrate-binding protein [Burkholderiales bacterium]